MERKISAMIRTQINIRYCHTMYKILFFLFLGLTTFYYTAYALHGQKSYMQVENISSVTDGSANFQCKIRHSFVPRLLIIFFGIT